MPDRCVVFGCSNLANVAKGISLHRIPFPNDEKSEAKRRRKRWVDFVKATRDKWVPTKNSAVCSEHFNPESSSRRCSVMSDSETRFSPRLTRDDFGIAAYPTIQTKIVTELTTRDRRMIKRKWMPEVRDDIPTASHCGQPTTSHATHANVELPTTYSHRDEQYKESSIFDSCESDPVIKEVAVQCQLECKNCAVLEIETRRYKNLWLGAKHKLKHSRAELNSSKLDETTEQDEDSTDISLASSMGDDGDDDFQDLQCDEQFVLSDHEDSLSEPEDDSENEPMYETETDEGCTTSYMETDTEQPRTFKRVFNRYQFEDRTKVF